MIDFIIVIFCLLSIAAGFIKYVRDFKSKKSCGFNCRECSKNSNCKNIQVLKKESNMYDLFN